MVWAVKQAENITSQAFISKSDKGSFTIITNDDLALTAAVQGKLRYHGKKLCVGDEVEYVKTDLADTEALIVGVKARHNSLLRPPLANLDELWLLVSIAEPEVNFCQVDQVICQAALRKINLRLILTKADLDLGQTEALSLLNYFQSAFPSLLISTKQAKLADLQALIAPNSPLAGYKVALTGLSGVGKSSLLNALLGDEYMLTQELSQKLKRGKQTTRHCQFFACGSLWLADTPGFSALDIKRLHLKAKDAILAYPDLKALATGCYFNDCQHVNEPNCAVKAKCTSGILQARWQNYCTFQKFLQNEEGQYVY